MYVLNSTTTSIITSFTYDDYYHHGGVPSPVPVYCTYVSCRGSSVVGGLLHSVTKKNFSERERHPPTKGYIRTERGGDGERGGMMVVIIISESDGGDGDGDERGASDRITVLTW